MHYYEPDDGVVEPKADPSHDDFDPYHMPMPKLKPGLDPYAAFKALDRDRDGLLNRVEFKHLSLLLTDLPKLHEMGMDRRTFIKRHAQGETLEDAEMKFSGVDENGNGRLSKVEYQRFRNRNEL
jgi:hypothetical protein